jgi:hypothetical protein
MVNKFIVIIAGIVAIMAALVAMPRIGSQADIQEDLSIEYSRQNLTRLEDGRFTATSAEDLVIGNDRSATYRNLTGGSDSKQFGISSEELDGLKRLVIGTGFMQVPGDDYSQREDLANVTKYKLILTSGDDSKSITWVNLEASEEAVPSIVRNIGAQLDDIIERRA